MDSQVLMAPKVQLVPQVPLAFQGKTVFQETGELMAIREVMELLVLLVPKVTLVIEASQAPGVVQDSLEMLVVWEMLEPQA